MTPRITLAWLLACLFLLPAAHAAPARPASAATDDDRAVLEEEKDRLAREKRDLKDREAALRKQLEMRKKLEQEQEAYLLQLQQQIRELKGSR